MLAQAKGPVVSHHAHPRASSAEAGELDALNQMPENNCPDVTCWPDTNALRLRDDTPVHSSPATPRAPVDDRAASQSQQYKAGPLAVQASFAQSSRCKSIRLAISSMHEEPARPNCMPRSTIAKTKETKQYVSLTKHPDKPGWADVLEGMKPQLSVGLFMCLGVSRRRVTLDDGARA